MGKNSAARKGLFLFVVLALFMAVSISYAESSEKNHLPVFYGAWEGMGSQDNDSTWSIRLNIRRETFIVEYPSLKCGGELSLLEQGEHYMSFKEKITDGRLNCVDGGTIVIQETGQDQLKYEWFYPNGKLGAVGLLKKVKAE